MHFLDVDKDLARGAFLQVNLELVDLRAFASDDDPRTGNLDRAHARRLEFVLQLFLQLDVFQKQLVVIALHEPARPPRLGVTQAKPVRMDFLSHAITSLYSLQTRRAASLRLNFFTARQPCSYRQISFSRPGPFSLPLPWPVPRLLPLRLQPWLETACSARPFPPAQSPCGRCGAGNETRGPSAPDECASCAARHWRWRSLRTTGPRPRPDLFPGSGSWHSPLPNAATGKYPAQSASW